MNAVAPFPAHTRHLMSGNEAVARAVWESGCKVAAAYPGTPSTEIMEVLARYPDIHSEWAVNEKVSLEVAIGASMMGSRAFCAMKHVGLNVASDALMTITLCGVGGGLVIAVADDVGLSSSQNEQDSRHWGRFAHIPVLEPADSQEAHAMIHRAFALSEEHDTPVILRMTTRICHVKAMVRVGERHPFEPKQGFRKDPGRWVMVPAHARKRIPHLWDREKALRELTEKSDLNLLEDGKDTRFGFVTSGPAYMHVREAFPDAPVLKLGLSYPPPLEKIRALAGKVRELVIVEEVEPLLETEVRAQGIKVIGKDRLPRQGELSPPVLRRALLGSGEVTGVAPRPQLEVFPRPPTMCAACPHLGVYYCLSHTKNLVISGDIGCYTLGAGHPWNALDTTICMGAAPSVALGMDKGRGPQDQDKRIVAVIGDSTFLHMGIQPLLDAVYNRGNITLLLLDNRTTGMTGGQEHAGTGRDIYGNPAPKVDFPKLVESLGVKPERIRLVDAYELPTVMKVIREETRVEDVSVIITDRPCVLTDRYEKRQPLAVADDKCTGCARCLDIGCPAIYVTRRGKATKARGKEVDLAWVQIDSLACTGCNLCVATCADDAFVPWNPATAGAPNA